MIHQTNVSQFLRKPVETFIANMIRTLNIAVNPRPLGTIRMPRRNAIVKRKRGRTNKSSDERLRDHFDDSFNILNDVDCQILSGSAIVKPFPESTKEEEQRRNKVTVRLHKDLMPLKELAMLMSTQLTCAQTKGLFDSDIMNKKVAGTIRECQ